MRPISRRRQKFACKGVFARSSCSEHKQVQTDRADQVDTILDQDVELSRAVEPVLDPQNQHYHLMLVVIDVKRLEIIYDPL